MGRGWQCACLATVGEDEGWGCICATNRGDSPLDCLIPVSCTERSANGWVVAAMLTDPELALRAMGEMGEASESDDFLLERVCTNPSGLASNTLPRALITTAC